MVRQGTTVSFDLSQPPMVKDCCRRRKPSPCPTDMQKDLCKGNVGHSANTHRKLSSSSPIFPPAYISASNDLPTVNAINDRNPVLSDLELRLASLETDVLIHWYHALGLIPWNRPHAVVSPADAKKHLLRSVNGHQKRPDVKTNLPANDLVRLAQQREEMLSLLLVAVKELWLHKEKVHARSETFGERIHRYLWRLETSLGLVHSCDKIYHMLVEF